MMPRELVVPLVLLHPGEFRHDGGVGGDGGGDVAEGGGPGGYA